MRIEPSEKIAGHPALEIRKLLRRGACCSWGINFVESILNVGPAKARRIVKMLESDGYIEKKTDSSFGSYWENTIKGNALALASAAPPVKRFAAERALSQLLERIVEVNSSDYFLYKVERAVVFGSNLSDSETVNDVDIAIQLVPANKDRDIFQGLLKQRRQKAISEGRSFNNLIEELCWPQTEVRRYLKIAHAFSAFTIYRTEY